MEFKDAERQVLLAIKAGSRRDAANRKWLDEHMELIFGKELLDWQPALASLIEVEAVLETSRGLSLAEDIGEQVTRMHNEWSAERFSDWMLKCEQSSTYSEFCRRLYGEDLCQFNMMNITQRTKLLAVLSLEPGSQVLDLGCGIGTVTEYLSDLSGARITGIDFAARAIQRAQERTEPKRERLIFETHDMDDLRFPSHSFDTIIAIDTLYFVFDLSRAMARCKQILKPGGQMGVFCTQIITPEEPRQVLQADKTRLAQVLKAHDLYYRTWDYTEDERRHWRLSKDIAEDLKSDFELEGNSDLYDGRIKESERLLKAVSDGRISRFLYHVRVCRSGVDDGD